MVLFRHDNGLEHELPIIHKITKKNLKIKKLTKSTPSRFSSVGGKDVNNSNNTTPKLNVSNFIDISPLKKMLN